ncbi:hypothetical protein TSMEX_000470 [Taenia solium]|eukprot:TsM_000925800 transcript=TsM_000925800 gene=TsM_000925800
MGGSLKLLYASERHVSAHIRLSLKNIPPVWAPPLEVSLRANRGYSPHDFPLRCHLTNLPVVPTFLRDQIHYVVKFHFQFGGKWIQLVQSRPLVITIMQSVSADTVTHHRGPSHRLSMDLDTCPPNYRRR